jgi:hypothetical protein
MLHGVNAIARESASFPKRVREPRQADVPNAAESHASFTAIEAEAVKPLLGPTRRHASAEHVTVGVHARLGKLGDLGSRELVDGSHSFYRRFCPRFSDRIWMYSD